MLKAPVAVEICRVVERGNETDKKPNVRTPKSTRKKAKKMPRKEDKMPADTEDADALPSIFDDPRETSEERPAPMGARPSPGPSDLRSSYIEGTSSPLKRKASPPGVVPPTPSKRQKT